MPASLAMRKAAAMHSPPSLRAEPAPSAHSHTARSHTARSHIVAWRSAAVVALGAALGLGFYLMLYGAPAARSEEHTSELQSLMRISYAVFCLKKKTHQITQRKNQ